MKALGVDEGIVDNAGFVQLSLALMWWNCDEKKSPFPDPTSVFKFVDFEPIKFHK